jgi:hypothetical protein
VIAVGMVLGGLGTAAYFVLAVATPSAPPRAPAETGSPQSVARAVVDRLNAKDLDGVIDLTCAQGKATGRRELTKAIPALDPAAPADVRGASISFELQEVNEFPEGYLAGISVSYEGTSQEGKMRLQRSGEKWTLCGLDAPRIGGTGLVGSG